MKRGTLLRRGSLLFAFLLCCAAVVQAEGHWSFKGTVVKMQMKDCVAQSRLRGALLGAANVEGSCPEYTLMSANVVYIVVARRSEEFIPLAEDMNFLIRKNEILIYSSDEKVKSRFVIREMMLRSEWEREQQQKDRPPDSENIERTAN